MMNWQWQMQRTLDMLRFREQLFTAVCSAKHAQLLDECQDKVEKSSRLKCVVFIETDDTCIGKRRSIKKKILKIKYIFSFGLFYEGWKIKEKHRAKNFHILISS